MPGPITIAGGGLSGLMLGLLLRREGIPVVLHEAGTYPRHKVCGEFISGKGLALLENAGVLDGLPAVQNADARFFLNGRSTAVLPLPVPARSLSRWELDNRLARLFASAGGDLRPQSRWTRGFEAPGLVRASGRQAAAPATARFVGLKVHLTDLPLSAGLELHFSPIGYAGLARLPGDRVNLCGLFRADAQLAGVRENPLAFFRSALRAPLEGQIVPHSFCSVAALETASGRWAPSREFCLGDALGVIPPLTGNGMSIAIESAFLAAGPLSDFARGSVTWDRALGAYSHNCKKALHRRLRVSSFLQRILLNPCGAPVLLSCLRTMPRILKPLFNLTR